MDLRKVVLLGKGQGMGVVLGRVGSVSNSMTQETKRLRVLVLPDGMIGINGVRSQGSDVAT